MKRCVGCGMEVSMRLACRECCKRWESAAAELDELERIIERSEIDFASCEVCNELILCHADGSRLCVPCAKREAESN